MFSAQRRRRLAFALRALDARTDGGTYSGEIAEVLFGAINPFPNAPGKLTTFVTEPLDSFKPGFALMLGGYRALLRPPTPQEIEKNRKGIEKRNTPLSSASLFAGPLLRDRSRQRAAIRAGALQTITEPLQCPIRTPVCRSVTCARPKLPGLLSLSGRTLEKHRTYGTGPAYRKIGGRVVYALDDLKAWADRGTKTSTSDPGNGTVLPAKTSRRPLIPYAGKSRR